jgi:hypothetical protein
MTDRERLQKLVTAESYLKQTTAGYSATGPWWKRAMPLIWEVRLSLKGTASGDLLAEAHGLLKLTEKGYDQFGPRWREAMRLIDTVQQSLSRPPVPALGPIEPVGKTLLLQALSHNTDGLKRPGQPSEYPAFDFGWDAGDPIIAPERWTVTDQSGAQGADACYLRGESGLLYWLGHIQRAPANDTVFAKGALVARIAVIPGADHGHIGINAMPLIGKDLLYGRNGTGPDYTWGSPTIGAQLAKELSV